jgi:hypothetical protein
MNMRRGVFGNIVTGYASTLRSIYLLEVSVKIEEEGDDRRAFGAEEERT